MLNYSIKEIGTCRKRETTLLAMVLLAVLATTCVFGKYLGDMHRQSTKTVLAAHVSHVDGRHAKALGISGIPETKATLRKAEQREGRLEARP